MNDVPDVVCKCPRGFATGRYGAAAMGTRQQFVTSTLLCALTLSLWGSIGTLAKLSRVKWVIFYFYYSIGLTVAALALWLGTGSWKLSFNLMVAPTLDVTCGILAGCCGCVGSMCFMSSIELIGVTISYPLVMGLEMSIGTALIYVVSPVAAPGLLFVACACMLAALTLDVLAQFQLSLDASAALSSQPCPRTAETTSLLHEVDNAADLAKPSLPSRTTPSSSSLGKHDFMSVNDELSSATSTMPCAVATSPSLLRTQSMEYLAVKELIIAPQHVSPAKLPDDTSSSAQPIARAATISTRMGLARAFVAGLLLSVWPALEAIAVGEHDESVVDFLLSFGIGHTMAFAVAVPLRALYLRRPASTSSTKRDQRRCVAIYASTRGAICGLLAGVLWLVGAWSIFEAGLLVGVTTSISVGRCSPVVAVLWGVMFWGEAKHASLRSVVYIGLALILYLATIVLVAFSSRLAQKAASTI